jgi:hypothetical protein
MLRRHLIAAGLGAAALAVATAPPALAGGGLRWSSPRTVTSGTPVAVASVDACPPLPNPGDTLLIQVNLLFSGGGGSGQVLSGNSDGSWSGSVTFSFTNAGSRADLTASCLDYNGTGATAYAQYASHHVKLG